MKFRMIVLILALVAILSACSRSSDNVVDPADTPAQKKAFTETDAIQMVLNSKKDNESFIVTFVKDWNVKVDNKEAISYWEYQVNSEGATLVKSENNENLIAIIK
ncbi:hypothetical protein [Paenibacillus koleovorans]|uniref:hypothetical protein n=1 Tax=Paenibacillus koleovorans TaxID=121608 RepID=UPI000FDCCC25|nr:hypothetical protein [Paenibacillus koleovorans]